MLIGVQCNIEIKGNQQNEDAPLALAARNGQAHVIRVLLSHGAYAHARDKYDYTPIMTAASGRHWEAVTGLVSSGANPNDETKPGKTALLFGSGGVGDS